MLISQWKSCICYMWSLPWLDNKNLTLQYGQPTEYLTKRPLQCYLCTEVSWFVHSWPWHILHQPLGQRSNHCRSRKSTRGHIPMCNFVCTACNAKVADLRKGMIHGGSRILALSSIIITLYSCIHGFDSVNYNFEVVHQFDAFQCPLLKGKKYIQSCAGSMSLPSWVSIWVELAWLTAAEDYHTDNMSSRHTILACLNNSKYQSGENMVWPTLRRAMNFFSGKRRHTKN